MAASLQDIPFAKISALVRLCGPAEVDQLIRELDALDDADPGKHFVFRTAFFRVASTLEAKATSSTGQRK
jgi:hypothetical protein